MAASTTLLGKYRSEVEIAVQHSLALSLPGARYELRGGAEFSASKSLANECLKGSRARRKLGRVGGTATGGCAEVLIRVPRAQQGGFRALLLQLKKRAFRLESEFISWHGAAPAGEEAGAPAERSVG